MRYFIYTSVYCHGCTASAEDSRRVCPACSLRIKSSHRILCFGIFIPIFCLVGKKGGNVLSNVLSFQYSSWKERAKYLPWPLLASKATHYFGFFLPPPLPSLSEVWSPEPVWRSGAAELEKDWNECYSTHCLSHARTHARTPTPSQASTCARALVPHLPNSVPRVVYHSVKYRGATESSWVPSASGPRPHPCGSA